MMVVHSGPSTTTAIPSPMRLLRGSGGKHVKDLAYQRVHTSDLNPSYDGI